ncbi:MAG TPA: metal-dependent hydrolase [Bryobacteraceae bacterium]|nr:metal-dependent hydrolase [Bryobacteraceae bacterium]
MDNLTHSLTGLMMSRAGLSRYHRYAPLALLLSANAPDIDGLSIFSGPLTYIRYHRGLAHSIPFMPVMTLLPFLVVLAITRKLEGWLRLYLLCLAGVASHLLLDWTNTYGVRFLTPFSDRWFSLDLNSLIDPWIWAVLIFAWLMLYIMRLVSGEIGAKKATGRGLAVFALVFFLSYDFGRYLLRQRALAVLNARMYDAAAPMRVAAFPAGGNPLVWRGWVETSTFFKRFDFSVTGDFDPAGGTTFYKPEQTNAVDAARTTPLFRQFLWFDQYPRWDVVPVDQPEGGSRVELKDLRLSFTAVAILDKMNRVVNTSFRF